MKIFFIPYAPYTDHQHQLPPPFACLPLLYAPEIAAAPDIAQSASRKIADRETLRQPRSLFSRLIASSDK